MDTVYILFFTVLCGSLDSGKAVSIQQSYHQSNDSKFLAASDRPGCQQYYARGYKYEHMYSLDGVAFDHTIVQKENNELRQFEMHLAVKTAKDAIILLSPKSKPNHNDLVFEFAIGIFFGQTSVLRLRREGSINIDEVQRIPHDEKIISPTEYTMFHIKIKNDVMTFGKEGEEPFIIYHDIRLRQIKYFDVSSYGDYDAKFLYDCPEKA